MAPFNAKAGQAKAPGLAITASSELLASGALDKVMCRLSCLEADVARRFYGPLAEKLEASSDAPHVCKMRMHWMPPHCPLTD